MQREGMGGRNSGINKNRMDNMAPFLVSKLDDPLIRAETEKKFKERKV